jgi:dUTPase
LDLHVGGDTYQACEDQYRRRPFRASAPGEGYVTIRPHHSVRVTTLERVGTNQEHTAIVVNVAGRAKHGLIVATGKVDPGFNPAPLLLVIHNQSNRGIKLRVGDKIAAIAFAKVSGAALPTSSSGHAAAPLGSDFEPPFLRRVGESLRTTDWSTLAWDTIKLFIAAVLTMMTLYVAYLRGWRRP